jgi:hypothetical protein
LVGRKGTAGGFVWAVADRRPALLPGRMAQARPARASTEGDEGYCLSSICPDPVNFRSKSTGPGAQLQLQPGSASRAVALPCVREEEVGLSSGCHRRLGRSPARCCAPCRGEGCKQASSNSLARQDSLLLPSLLRPPASPTVPSTIDTRPFARATALQVCICIEAGAGPCPAICPAPLTRPRRLTCSRRSLPLACLAFPPKTPLTPTPSIPPQAR